MKQVFNKQPVFPVDSSLCNNCCNIFKELSIIINVHTVLPLYLHSNTLLLIRKSNPQLFYSALNTWLKKSVDTSNIEIFKIFIYGKKRWTCWSIMTKLGTEVLLASSLWLESKTSTINSASRLSTEIYCKFNIVYSCFFVRRAP